MVVTPAMLYGHNEEKIGGRDDDNVKVLCGSS